MWSRKWLRSVRMSEEGIEEDEEWKYIVGLDNITVHGSAQKRRQ